MKAVVWHGTQDVRVEAVPDLKIEQPPRVATRCRRRPQKNREWLAQYPYSAQPARSERWAVSLERPHSTGVGMLNQQVIGSDVECGREGVYIVRHTMIMDTHATPAAQPLA